MERSAEALIHLFDHHELIRKLMLEEVSGALYSRSLLDLHKLLEKLLIKLLFFVNLDGLVTLLLHEVGHQ